MKMKFKKTLSLILAVLMVMTAIPLSGMATDADCTHADVTVTQSGTNKHTIICNNDDCDYAVIKEECYSTDDGDGSCESPILCDVCDRRLGTVEHNFNLQLEVEAAIVEAVACSAFNRYYKSCVCGAVSTLEGDIFDGTTKGSIHDFTAKVEEEKYLVKDSVATCEKGLEYYYACANEECEEKGTETFFSDVTGDHVWQELEAEKYLKSKEICDVRAVYYKSCSLCEVSAKDVAECTEKEFDSKKEPHKRPTTTEGVATAEELNEKHKDIELNLKEEDYIFVNADCYNNALCSMLCATCFEPMATTEEEAVTLGLDYYEVPNTAINPGHHDLTKLELVADRIEPTCTTKGQEAIYRCPFGSDCPDWKNSQELHGEVIPAKDHSFASDKATKYEASESCEGGGKYARKYCTACNTSFFYDDKGVEVDSEEGLKEKKFAGKKHVNNDGDDLCDVCGYFVKPSDTCNCICHKTGFMYIVALFLKLFWKFTGKKEYCDCSSIDEIVKHY